MSGKTKNLSAMLGADIEPAEAVRPPAPAPPKQASETIPVENELVEQWQTPKWLTFERKETRIRADQIEFLESVRIRLNSQRGRSGERLTDNTFVRIAIDLLMERESELRGVTESQIRSNLGISVATNS